jgi:hypothetical protein
MLSLYSPSAGACTLTERNTATPLRSLVRLLPAADTRAATLPSGLKALPFSSTCAMRCDAGQREGGGILTWQRCMEPEAARVNECQQQA